MLTILALVLSILTLGWIPFWLGMYIFFKIRDRRDMNEAIQASFKVMMENPEYLRKILGIKDTEEK